MTLEKKVNLKFCVKLEKIATETLKMLREIYENSAMSSTKVFEWHKRFVEGREDVEDDPKSGRPCTFTTNANIEKVRHLVCVMANEFGMDKETV